MTKHPLAPSDGSVVFVVVLVSYDYYRFQTNLGAATDIKAAREIALPASTGSASAWMRAVWLESDRIHFASLMVFWIWYNAMSNLHAAGFVMRRGGVQ